MPYYGGDNMKVCPECKNEVEDNIEICPECGYEISKETIICPECNNIVKKGVKTCPECGYEISKETIICPECNNVVDKGVKTCPECGYDIAHRTLVCPECNGIIRRELKTCPNCGYEIPQEDMKDKVLKLKQSVLKNKKQTRIVAYIIAVFMFVIAISRLNNSDYKFYKEHYSECELGYQSAIISSQVYSGYFASSYKQIASTYKDMMNEDQAKINSYRIQAVVLIIIGIMIIIFERKYIGREN